MFWRRWIVALATVIVTTQLTPVSADICRSRDCGITNCDCNYSEGWTVYADWLYWKAGISDMDYASTHKEGADSTRSVSLDYDNGIRIGVLQACGCWNFGVHYTSYSTDPSDSIKNADIRNSEISQDNVQVLNADIKLATGNYNLEFKQVDLEAGYDLECFKCLSVRPFSGFRWAKIQQKFEARYEGEVTGTENPVPFDLVKNKNDMNFYGAYLGSRASFTTCGCLGIFGGFSFGIGAADFNRSYGQFKKNAVPKEKIVKSIKLHDDYWETVSVIDLNAGVSFHLSNCLSAEWDFSVGYEFHNWFNIQDFIGFGADDSESEFHIKRHSDDLRFDGLFVRVSATF